MKLLAQLEQKIGSAETAEEAILWTKLYGLICWSNQTHPLANTKLEMGIYHRIADLTQLPSMPCDPQSHGERAVHIATEVSSVGGHTTLLANIAKCLETPSDLLLTAQTVHFPDARLQGCFEKIHTLPASPRSAAVASIVRILEPYPLIFLHIHPNDIETAIACLHVKQAYRNKRIFLVNHADHVFSFGYAASDCILEISRYGWSLEDEREVNCGSFVGIPIRRSSEFRSIPNHRPYQRIISVGSSEKFRPNKEVSFPRFVRRVLQSNPNATFLIVGPRIATDFWWWLCKLQFPTRCKVPGPLCHSKYLEELREASVYVDSFPMTGGTAFPEAYAEGIQVAGLNTGIYGYTALDSIKCQSENELFSSVDALLKGKTDFSSAKNKLAQLFYDVHSIDQFKRRLNDAVFRNQYSPPPLGTVTGPLVLRQITRIINLGGLEFTRLITQATPRWTVRAMLLLFKHGYIPRGKDIAAFMLAMYKRTSSPKPLR